MENKIETINVKDIKIRKDFEELFPHIQATEFEELKNDIKERGIITALQLNQDNILLCGHQRLRVAKELKLQSVPCTKFNITDDDDLVMHVIKDNIRRRDLSTAQRIEYGKKLHEIESRKAEKRMHAGKKTEVIENGKKHPMANLQHREDTSKTKGKIMDVVAKEARLSRVIFHNQYHHYHHRNHAGLGQEP